MTISKKLTGQPLVLERKSSHFPQKCLFFFYISSYHRVSTDHHTFGSESLPISRVWNFCVFLSDLVQWHFCLKLKLWLKIPFLLLFSYLFLPLIGIYFCHGKNTRKSLKAWIQMQTLTRSMPWLNPLTSEWFPPSGPREALLALNYSKAVFLKNSSQQISTQQNLSGLFPTRLL